MSSSSSDDEYDWAFDSPSDPALRRSCTIENCDEVFPSTESMKRHKKYNHKLEYCYKCDEDFGDFDLYVHHMIARPEKHPKACRICGDDFKTDSGLKRHIELRHKVKQKLECIGCHQTFHAACLFIEHIELNKCKVISASELVGRVIHKKLIDHFLKDPAAYKNFTRKTAKHDAAIDTEEEGGITLLDDSLGADKNVQVDSYLAIEPEVHSESSEIVENPFPRLPSQKRTVSALEGDMASGFDALSIDGESNTANISPRSNNALTPSSSCTSVSSPGKPQTGTLSVSTARPQSKAWGIRDGRTTSKVLFPEAKPTPALADFSITAHDEAMEKAHGINIMRTRFWDPLGSDYHPEKFYDTMVNQYACPFNCEQMFLCAADLSAHILSDHRTITHDCPTCSNKFQSLTGLMAHCESSASFCGISKKHGYNLFLDRVSGGFLEADTVTRPDHGEAPAVMRTNDRTGRMQVYSAPVVTYVKYSVCAPADWKAPEKVSQIGGGGEGGGGRAQ